MSPAGADALVLGLLRPLDGVRRALLRPFAPALRRLFVDRDGRVALLGLGAVGLALGAVLAAPLWLLLVSPLVLGLPHLVADARYLVVRQGFHRRPAVVVAVLVPALATTLAPGLRLGTLGLAGAVAVARTNLRRRALAALPVAALLLAATRWEPEMGLALAHAHNLVALGVWAWWVRGPSRWRGVVPVATAGVLALLAAGTFDDVALRPGALRAPTAGFDLGRAVDELSPVTPHAHPLAAARWVLAFAFLQSVHYAVWLRLIPDEDRARPAPRGFVASWQAAVEDLGLPFLGAALLVTLGLLGGALASVAAARGAYLRLASGHGYAELALLLLLGLEGGARRADGAIRG